MQLCNDTITLYNRRFDPDEDCDVYERTVIRGVHWFNSEATTVDSTGLKAANKVTIRIPTDADFGGKVYLPLSSTPPPMTLPPLLHWLLAILWFWASVLRICAPPLSMTPTPRLQPSCRSQTTAALHEGGIGK